jgi:hypothetical protein
MLVSLRHDGVTHPTGGFSARVTGLAEGLAFRFWAWTAKSPTRFHQAAKFTRWLFKVPGFKGLVRFFPPASGWVFARELPEFPERFGWEE